MENSTVAQTKLWFISKGQQYCCTNNAFVLLSNGEEYPCTNKTSLHNTFVLLSNGQQYCCTNKTFVPK